jgi:hypothetical protein
VEFFQTPLCLVSIFKADHKVVAVEAEAGFISSDDYASVGIEGLKSPEPAVPAS